MWLFNREWSVRNVWKENDDSAGGEPPETFIQWAVAENLYTQSFPQSLYLIGITAKLTS